jgi:hypothetical protein
MPFRGLIEQPTAVQNGQSSPDAIKAIGVVNRFHTRATLKSLLVALGLIIGSLAGLFGLFTSDEFDANKYSQSVGAAIVFLCGGAFYLGYVARRFLVQRRLVSLIGAKPL